VDDAYDGPHAREPQIEDLTRICSALNAAGARYLLIGGSRDAETLTIDGVVIPVPSLPTLIRMKETKRPSDATDRLYLEQLLKAQRDEA